MCVALSRVCSVSVQNVVGVWASEVIVDVLKHAFLAKFNDLSPDVYTSFLLSMCKQVQHCVHSACAN